MSVAYRWIHRVWYHGAKSGLVLLPLSGLFCLLLKLRSLMYLLGIFRTHRIQVPVLVVGNITAGGTGKTPTVIWLANALRARGFRPGIVSRGYGGERHQSPLRVSGVSDPSIVGDEPVMLAKRTSCPVVVDADRVRAASVLVKEGVDVIVADDGLQHRRLQRDFEICVIDGQRGLGNGRLLPSGPLREPATRLQSVDQILVNGGVFPVGVSFELAANEAIRLNGSLTRPLADFKGKTVHAIAGIGNPQRFFSLLRAYDVFVVEHEFSDHAAISLDALRFDDEYDVFMTEKDAVKIRESMADNYWSIPVDLCIDGGESEILIERIVTSMKSHRSQL